MAVTKIHAISATVEKAVNYICNPQKTDGEVLVSTFNCGRESVAYDFGFALNFSNSPDKNLSYHTIIRSGRDFRRRSTPDRNRTCGTLPEGKILICIRDTY